MNRRSFVGSLGLATQALAPRFEKYRATALRVLNASKKDIEHGLELHRASVVVESYGFAPRCAIDAAAYTKEFEAGASDLELEDLWEEMLMTRCVTNAAQRDEYKAAWEASGVTCILQNAGEEGQDPTRLMKRLARFTYVTDMMRDFVRKASTPDDIVAAKKANAHAMYFSGNGVPLTQRWASVQGELGFVRIFYQLGIRMMHLTYNRRNMIGDGCAETANGGLSDFGRAAIAEMNRVGVIVDCAHSGWQTSLEAAKASTRPMVASHTGAVEMNRHIRCKPDEVIRAIADTGGYAGVCCIPDFLGRTGDLRAMLDHIDHIKRRFGADHVAIGTDVAYVPQSEGKIPRRKQRTPFEYYWTPDAFGKYPSRDESMEWTNWPMFTVGMVQRGYSDSDIQKIIGGNVLRVARAVLPKQHG